MINLISNTNLMQVRKRIRIYSGDLEKKLGFVNKLGFRYYI